MDVISRIESSVESIREKQYPYNYGVLKYPDVYSRIKGNCGDTMEIFLIFEDNVVKDASYKSDGCIFSNLCGSIAAGIAVGKQLEDLPKISGELILRTIANYPVEEEHCAFLAAETLRSAYRKHKKILEIKKKHQKNKS